MLASEPILFRTRTVILTNQRLFVDGMMVPLAQISAVRSKRPAYFVPLLAARALTLAGVAATLAEFAGRLGDDAGVIALAAPLGIGLALAALLYWLLREAPSYVVQIDTAAERITVLHAVDVERAQALVRKINDALKNNAGPAA